MALPLTCDRTVDPTEGMPAVTATLNYLAPMTGRLISTYPSSDGVPRTNGNFEGREVLVRDLNALVFPHRVGETYAVSYNPAHRWYYAPGMDRDEALLIKCYDFLGSRTVSPVLYPTPPSTTLPLRPVRGALSSVQLHHGGHRARAHSAGSPVGPVRWRPDPRGLWLDPFPVPVTALQSAR